MARGEPRRVAQRDFESPSAVATEDLGAALGTLLEAGDVVALDGELGTGKTAFVRGLARGLGVDETVNSPTYVLMNTYSGRLELFHFDAWMEGREQAFLEDGGDEWLCSGGVAAIEWAERVRAWLPLPRLEVQLTHLGPERRHIRMRALAEAGAAGGRWEQLLAALPAPAGDARG